MSSVDEWGSRLEDVVQALVHACLDAAHDALRIQTEHLATLMGEADADMAEEALLWALDLDDELEDDGVDDASRLRYLDAWCAVASPASAAAGGLLLLRRAFLPEDGQATRRIADARSARFVLESASESAVIQSYVAEVDALHRDESTSATTLLEVAEEGWGRAHRYRDVEALQILATARISALGALGDVHDASRAAHDVVALLRLWHEPLEPRLGRECFRAHAAALAALAASDDERVDVARVLGDIEDTADHRPDDLPRSVLDAVLARALLHGSHVEEAAAVLDRIPASAQSDHEVAAEICLLRALVALQRGDSVGLSRLVRQAHPLVARSTDPEHREMLTALVDGLDRVAGPARHRGATEDRHHPSWTRLMALQESMQAGDLGPRVEHGLQALADDESGLPDVRATAWALTAVCAHLDRRNTVALRRAEAAMRACRTPSVASGTRLSISVLVGAIAAAVGDLQRAHAISEEIRRELAVRDAPVIVGLVHLLDLAVAQMSGVPPVSAACHGVAAFRAMERFRLSLPSASERDCARALLAPIIAGTLDAAEKAADPEVLAEIIEIVQAQTVPVVPRDGDPTHLSLVTLLSDLAVPASPWSPPDLEEPETTLLSTPPVVIMPWGVTTITVQTMESSDTPRVHLRVST